MNGKMIIKNGSSGPFFLSPVVSEVGDFWRWGGRVLTTLTTKNEFSAKYR